MRNVLFLLPALVLLTGCGSMPSTTQPGTGKPGKEKSTLRVLVVDNSGDLARTLQEQWQTRTNDEELEVRVATSAELATARRLSADVVVFPARWMGELAERELIQPAPEAMLQSAANADAILKLDDLLPTVRQCDVSWGRKVYAVTLGSPQLVLLYRPDIFARLELQPPATWAEYQTAVVKLADRAALGDLAPAEGQPWHAALEPTAEGWAGITLLARAASAVRTEGQMYALFDLDKMSSRIASPPLVKVAQEMSAAVKISGAADRRLTPAQVRDAFFAGECGMALTWPAAAGAAESKTLVAFAELPGRADYFSFQAGEWTKKSTNVDPRTSLCAVSGQLAAVTREARRSRSAFQFLAWLSSEETVRVLGPASPQTTMFTRSQLASPAPWVGNISPEASAQYAKVVEASFSRALWIPVVRLPGIDAYHSALDEAVWQSLADSDKAADALSAAAQKWDDVTKQHDLIRQRRAYQRSLGNDF